MPAPSNQYELSVDSPETIGLVYGRTWMYTQLEDAFADAAEMYDAPAAANDAPTLPMELRLRAYYRQLAAV